ncbi:Polyketide cyclase / dehydrase and lipid transport [Methylobacillus rhizosphaerae]|uniref:Polyketide cyclase / dehydrase and lipid transport n=1 Tax=Methylobacillus rhizosphaerae TaxID=551994 RepID=A0A238Y360_9PROT|nr:SRPBCC family protein [Methylobacillus rhizosphaerae]SNR65716.1 Polyketide cyclase / dehydrase and lipid transport [Methylobacillus rhizosphaerae]
MKKILALLAIGMLPLTAAAHGPSPQKVEKIVTINASADKVWALVKDFGNWQKWHPAVESTKLDKRKDESGEEQTVRLLTLKGGGTILENLKSIDEEGKQIKYGIIEGVLPVSDYYSTVTVKPVDGGKSEVKWMGRFYRVYKLNPPIPPGQDDKSALDAVNGVYDTGLANLKKVAEGQ